MEGGKEGFRFRVWVSPLVEERASEGSGVVWCVVVVTRRWKN